MNYVSHWNYDYTKSFSKQLDSVSVTVPGMSKPLSYHIARMQNGLAVATNAVENVSGDVSMYDNMSSFDRIDAARALAKRVDALQSTINDTKAKIAKAKSDADFNAAVKSGIDSLISAKTSLNEKQ